MSLIERTQPATVTLAPSRAGASAYSAAMRILSIVNPPLPARRRRYVLYGTYHSKPL